MAHSPAMLVIESYCAVHGRLLAFAQKLTDEQLFWRLNPADVSSALLKAGFYEERRRGSPCDYGKGCK